MRRPNRTFRSGVVVGLVVGIALSFAFWGRVVPKLLAGMRRYVRRESQVAHPVLIINRWSGDGKAERYGLQEAAAAIGVETVMLEPGDDLKSLAEDAINRGADAIGMAGGDGSLGLVASVAVDRDVAFFCVPVGTRNHFALDVGLNRDDPLSALEAIRSGEEILIDYGMAGSRVFLNNVSLGIYAEAVGKDKYRQSKAETVWETMVAAVETEEGRPDVQFKTPDGATHDTSPMVLVSNNRYVSSGPPDFGRRERLDAGVLGIAAATVRSPDDIVRSHPRHLHEWEATAYVVESAGGTLKAGVDGESVELPSPLTFEIRPKGLRVLVPKGVRPGYVAPGVQLAGKILEFYEVSGEPEPLDEAPLAH